MFEKFGERTILETFDGMSSVFHLSPQESMDAFFTLCWNGNETMENYASRIERVLDVCPMRMMEGSAREALLRRQFVNGLPQHFRLAYN